MARARLLLLSTAVWGFQQDEEGPLAPQAGVDCWEGDFTREFCCSGAPGGNPSCWDMVHTFDLCCAEELPELALDATREDRALRTLTSPYAVLQSKKLQLRPDRIRRIDQDMEQYIFERFEPLASELRGSSVLCIGARLGGEVRAFGRLGALAVGVDFNPGERNLHILPGDACNLQFADAVFDHLYCNILDHIKDLSAFLVEAHRVLKPMGRLWLDVSSEAPGVYEVRDLRGQVPALVASAAGHGFQQVGEARQAGNHVQVLLLRLGSSPLPPEKVRGLEF